MAGKGVCSLRRGDALPCGQRASSIGWSNSDWANGRKNRFVRFPGFPSPGPVPEAGEVIELRCIRGRHFTELDRQVKRHSSASFMFLPISDRMGFRLAGPPLQFRRGMGELNSACVPCAGPCSCLRGAEQSLLLMADGAPTGGYPQLAHLISADWISPGSWLREAASVFSRSIGTRPCRRCASRNKG